GGERGGGGGLWEGARGEGEDGGGEGQVDHGRDVRLFEATADTGDVALPEAARRIREHRDGGCDRRHQHELEHAVLDGVCGDRFGGMVEPLQQEDQDGGLRRPQGGGDGRRY